MMREGADVAYYASLGRITSSFNNIDTTINSCGALLMWTDDFVLASMVFEKDRTFAKKIDILRSILKHLASEYPSLEKAAENLRQTLNAATIIAEQRNSLVHSTAEFDAKAGVLVLTHKEKESSKDLPELLKLEKSVARLEVTLIDAAIALSVQLDGKKQWRPNSEDTRMDRIVLVATVVATAMDTGGFQ